MKIKPLFFAGLSFWRKTQPEFFLFRPDLSIGHPKIAPFRIYAWLHRLKRSNFRDKWKKDFCKDFLKFPIAYNAGAHPPYFVPFQIGIDICLLYCLLLFFSAPRHYFYPLQSVIAFSHSKGKCCISYAKFRLCSL